MAEQSLLKFTDELLESSCLYCAICKDILKPPILLVETIGNVCTICYKENQLVTNLKSMNNSALEDVLSLLKLPCKFRSKGCIERFSYGELALHQNNCKFHTKVCAMSGCEWQGNSFDLVDHFKECHGHHVINSENDLFSLKTSLNEINTVKLLVMKQQTYMLRMKNELLKNKIYYMICSVNDHYSSFSEYTVKHKGSSDNYIKTKSKILSSYFIYDKFDENIAVKIDVDALKNISQVSIFDNVITNIFKIKGVESPLKTLNENISCSLECPVCKNIMKPPIHQCHSGHSVCNLCRPRLEKCPSCRSAFGNTRNYSLEELTAGITYPCIYHDSGCTETGSAADMDKHEKGCTFKHYSCPFPGCTFSGNHDNIVNHFNNAHSVRLRDGYSEFKVKLCDYRSFSPKFIIAYNHIFEIAIEMKQNHFLVIAEVVGGRVEDQNNSEAFVIEVTAMDKERPERKLIMTDYCIDQQSEQRMVDKSIVFPHNVLSSYCNNGTVTFNFTIKEK